jgi:hypothetical protein
MKNRSTRRGQRVVLSLLATSLLAVGSPVIAADAAGAQKPVSAAHGDCKNNNAGQHKGYVCPSPTGGDQSTDNGGSTGGDTGGVLIF